MSEEWGPWIEHDGGPCPIARGEYIKAQQETGKIVEGVMVNPYWADGWNRNWPPLPSGYVVRYRIRKPRGLTMLEEIAKGVREPVDT